MGLIGEDKLKLFLRIRGRSVGPMKQAGRVISGKRLYLAYLTPGAVTQRYVGWLNDKEVNRYLEARFGCPYTLRSVREFVETQYNDPDSHMFAIMLKEGERHIGNIKVGPINRHHNFAEVGIIIGEKSLWGRGYGAEAVGLASKYAFEKLHLHKLIAGCYDTNMGSEKAFAKAGFARNGVVKGKFLCGGKYVGDIIFSMTNPHAKK